MRRRFDGARRRVERLRERRLGGGLAFCAGRRDGDFNGSVDFSGDFLRFERRVGVRGRGVLPVSRRSESRRSLLRYLGANRRFLRRRVGVRRFRRTVGGSNGVEGAVARVFCDRALAPRGDFPDRRTALEALEKTVATIITRITILTAAVERRPARRNFKR